MSVWVEVMTDQVRGSVRSLAPLLSPDEAEDMLRARLPDDWAAVAAVEDIMRWVRGDVETPAIVRGRNK